MSSRTRPDGRPGVSRRAFVGAGLAAAALARPGGAAAAEGLLTPEMFGAKGDGRSNDTAAFDALSRRVNAQGGGTVVLRKTVYIVGEQIPVLTPGTAFGFAPKPLFHFRRLSGPLVIQGNGATLRCAPGLRYGTFNVATGEAVKHPMPYLGQSDRATPYAYMLAVEECTGSVAISDLELDGNLPRLRIGGPYGDTGYQIEATGLYLRDNRGDEILRNIHTHHHPQDGLMIDGIDDAALARKVTRRIENVRSEYNARQGCSLTGGRGYVFTGCRFNHTGMAGLYSAPGAGLDIEAEAGKRNIDHVFTDCEFVNNTGCGMVADSGPSEGATFSRCKFVGTKAWAAWPYKPRFRFSRCTFVGASVKCYGDPDPKKAAQFLDCTFTDDPRLSPTGKVYLAGGKSNFIVDLAESFNVLFSRCTFRLIRDGLLPWSWHALYADCRMEQASPGQAYPKGKYLGHSTLRGNVDLYGTHVIGTLVLNGQTITNTQLGGTVNW